MSLKSISGEYRSFYFKAKICHYSFAEHQNAMNEALVAETPPHLWPSEDVDDIDLVDTWFWDTFHLD